MKTVDVQTFLDQTTHPKREILLALRDVIRSTDPTLHEHIKWNAPSYQAGGDDRITLNLSKPDAVKIVLHQGATAKDTKTGHRLIDDPSTHLIWATDQRASLQFESMDQVTAQRDWLAGLLRKWIDACLTR
jgi:hypothetical protein